MQNGVSENRLSLTFWRRNVLQKFKSLTLEWTRLAASGVVHSNVETLFLGKSVLKLRHLRSLRNWSSAKPCGIPGLEVINGRALKPI